MLDDAARKGRYLAQTARRELTPRQKRRAWKKWMHQSQEALIRRHHAAKLRARAVEQRIERRAALAPSS